MLMRRDREAAAAAAAAITVGSGGGSAAPRSEPRVTFNGDEMEIEIDITHDLDLLDSLQRSLAWGTIDNATVMNTEDMMPSGRPPAPPPARQLASATVRPLPTSSIRPSQPPSTSTTRLVNLSGNVYPTRAIPRRVYPRRSRSSNSTGPLRHHVERNRQERETERSVADIAASIDRADADAGLDFISVAHRTRAARRGLSLRAYTYIHTLNYFQLRPVDNFLEHRLQNGKRTRAVTELRRRCSTAQVQLLPFRD